MINFSEWNRHQNWKEHVTSSDSNRARCPNSASSKSWLHRTNQLWNNQSSRGAGIPQFPSNRWTAFPTLVEPPIVSSFFYYKICTKIDKSLMNRINTMFCKQNVASSRSIINGCSNSFNTAKCGSRSQRQNHFHFSRYRFDITIGTVNSYFTIGPIAGSYIRFLIF